MPPERMVVTQQRDVERARRRARELAQEQGLSRENGECVALAVSELATNLVRYASGGMIQIAETEGPRGAGVEIQSIDTGPGIADLAQAMRDGFSTGGGLGSGLPAVRRLMDEFAIESTTEGTRVVARKWR